MKTIIAIQTAKNESKINLCKILTIADFFSNQTNIRTLLIKRVQSKKTELSMFVDSHDIFHSFFFLIIYSFHYIMEITLPGHHDNEAELDIEYMKNQLQGCSEQNSLQLMKRSTCKRLRKAQKQIPQEMTPQDNTKLKEKQVIQSPNSLLETLGNQSVKSFVDGSSRTHHRASYQHQHSTKIMNNRMTAPRRKKRTKELRDILKDQKVNQLKTVFCHKIKRNNQYSPPIQLKMDQEINRKSFFHRKGIVLKQSFEKIILFVEIYNVIRSIIICTLSLVFPEIQQKSLTAFLEMSGAILFFVEIVFNFTTVRFSLGKKLETLRDIGQDYISERFPLDFVNFLMIVVYLTTKEPLVGYFRLMTLLKLQDCMEKIQKLEVYFIKNYHYEHYWSLSKVLLFNFCFAHAIAIVLIAMSDINPSNNWLMSKNLHHSPWLEIYVWSYYWATTTMLTVGFGDFVPVCYQEALCMVFVMTMSCMVLAYNISCVGTLISEIRSRDIEKSKNLKIFKKLADKNEISETLTGKVNNYIEERTNIQKLFNVEEQVQFIDHLPPSFRTEYLKQANKKIFHNIFFFTHLMQKTLFALAQKITVKIAHPQQLILTPDTVFDVCILKSGDIGYISNNSQKRYSQYVFDKIKIRGNSAPFLLHANFIMNNRLNYNIKSFIYSALYVLGYQNLVEVLKQNYTDFQFLSKLKDKCHNKIDQFQVLPCEFCTGQKHTKFSCTRLHFIPIKQQVINKELFNLRNSKNLRSSKVGRYQYQKSSALNNFLYFKTICDKKSRVKTTTKTTTKTNRQRKYFAETLTDLQAANHIHLRTVDDSEQKQGGTGIIINKIQSLFLENASQTIKNQINYALGLKKDEDNVWLLKLDLMKNYKVYFADGNPYNLVNKFKVEDRTKQSEKSSVSSVNEIKPKNLLMSYSNSLTNTEKKSQQIVQSVQEIDFHGILN